LEHEHRDIENLLAHLEDASDAATQQPLVEELVAKLAAHMEVEETEVYPKLAELDVEAAEEADIEHELAREGVTKLLQLIGAPGFGAAVDMVRAGIAHHVEEEEREAFPLLRHAVGGGVTDDSTKADLYEAAKRAGVQGRSTMSKEELAQAVEAD
jgi:hemerythrin-like domain-containing protein